MSQSIFSFMLLFILLSASCELPYSVLVTVSGIPQETRSVMVLSVHNNIGNLNPIAPYNFVDVPPSGTSLLLTFSNSLEGDIEVNLGAYDQPDGTGCLLAIGSSKNVEFQPPNDTMRIPLNPITPPACKPQIPLLLNVTPSLGNSLGGELIRLDGWGFRPDTIVRFGMTPAASLTYVSASELMVKTPAHSAYKQEPININNINGMTDNRNDLFRFYADPLVFAINPVPTTPPTYNNLGSFASGHFKSAASVELAFPLRTVNLVRIYSFDKGIPLTPVSYPVGTEPSGLATGDLNGDNFPDLVVANSRKAMTNGSVQVLLNDKTGVFGVGAEVPVGADPETIALADIDGDGDLDVITGNNTGKSISILKNNGAGALGPAINIPVRGAAVSITTGDINGDNHPEIVVATQVVDGITILYNDGKGVFFQGYDGTAGISPASVLLVDVDRNGATDLIVSNSGSDTVSIFKNSNGLYIDSYTLNTTPGPRSIIYTDLNGDGFEDLAVATYGNTAMSIGGALNFFLNKGGMGFDGVGRQVQATSCSHVYQLGTTDINGDARSDLGVVGEDSAGVGCVGLLFNQTP